ISISNGAALVFNRNNTYTNANAISGAGSVRQIGVGTTVLTASNGYIGATTVEAGTLQIAINGRVVSSGITVSSLATLQVDGAAGSVTAQDGATVQGAGTITNLAGSSNGVVKILTAATNTAGAWNTFGAITFSGGSTVNVTGLSLIQQPYVLVRGTSVTGTPALQGATGFTVANTNNSIQLIPTLDTDGDGLSDYEESQIGTNPNLADSDGDGLNDAVETNTGVFQSVANTGTNPNNPDSDGDGFNDGLEVNTYGTNPNSIASNPKPVITSPPADVTGRLGASSSLSVVVATNFGPFTYQWRKGGAPVAGGTNASLTFPSLQPADVADYDVVVANTYGSVTSPVACLTLNTARGFGSGTNAFSIEFVVIGNPGNTADTTGAPNPVGSVASTYNLGKYEISRDMISKANAAGGLNLTLGDITGATSAMPATGIDWYEAARFVNWLNTSQGYQAAYKFSGTNFSLWTNGETGYQTNNPYRNSLARYWLPSVHEWYKGAYGSPSGTWYDYPTGSDSAPTAVSSGTNANTAVFKLSFSFPGDEEFFDGDPPADITNAGGLSAFGTMAQGGNAWEWVETASDGTNDNATEARYLRGGQGTDTDVIFLNASTISAEEPQYDTGMKGFRVASADFTALDSDGDGLNDAVETNTGIFQSAANTGTNPNNPDTDGDGISDGVEVALGTSPTSSQVPGSLVTQYPVTQSFVATWGAVSGAAGYELQVATEPSFTTGLVGSDRPVSGGTTTSVAVTGVTNQIRYYRVRSVFASSNGPVKGGWSPAVSAPDMSGFGKYAALNGGTTTTNYFQAGALY
ncbi:MAG: beta strand repeat-containing protein, partial [Verrucomicrobiota bacterium]